MKLVDGCNVGKDFLLLQFEPTESEKKQLADWLGRPIEEFEKSWINLGQYKSEKNVLDCVQVYTDASGSNCDMVFSDFKADFLESVQNLFNTLIPLKKSKLKKHFGTDIELNVA